MWTQKRYHRLQSLVIKSTGVVGEILLRLFFIFDMKKFNKQERSSWRYFWAHWCAFQMVAVTLGVWKPKHLFHDWYKPWLKMFGVPYEDIQKFHRMNSSHHLEYLEYKNPVKLDWVSLVVDWECSQYTKNACKNNARAEMEDWISNNIDDTYTIYCLNRYMRPLLDKYNL